MSFVREIKKIGWRCKSYYDFFTPRHALYGQYLTGNLGDSAGVYVLNQLFNIDLGIISGQSSDRIPKNIKTLICGAGGALNEVTMNFFLKNAKRIKSNKSPVLLISAGINRDFNDLSIIKNEGIFRQFLKLFDYVSLRDKASLQFAHQLGVKKAVLFPDLVFSLPGNAAQVSESQLAKQTVGIVIASHTSVVTSRFSDIKKFLKKVCRDLLAKGYKIKFIPFQIDTISEKRKVIDDRILAKEIVNELNAKDLVEELTELLPLEGIVDFFRDNLSFVISMRLHGNVIAARAGLPFISLSYNDKHLAFLDLMDKMEFNCSMAEELDDKIVMEKICLIEKNYQKITFEISDKVKNLNIIANNEIQSLKTNYFKI